MGATHMNILFFLTPKEDVAHVEETDTMRQVLEKMEHHGYTAIPLLGVEGKYIGTITEGDLLWFLKDRNFPDLKLLEDMPITSIERRRDNQAVKIDESMENLFDKVMNQNFVPVVDDKKVFIGIVTRKDVLAYLGKKALLRHNDKPSVCAADKKSIKTVSQTPPPGSRATRLSPPKWLAV